jgi:hypothetical protein
MFEICTKCQPGRFGRKHVKRCLAAVVGVVTAAVVSVVTAAVVGVVTAAVVGVVTNNLMYNINRYS